MWNNTKVEEDFTLNVIEDVKLNCKLDISCKNEAEIDEIKLVENGAPNDERQVENEPQIDDQIIDITDIKTKGLIDLTDENILPEVVIDLTDETLLKSKKEPMCDLEITKVQEDALINKENQEKNIVGTTAAAENIVFFLVPSESTPIANNSFIRLAPLPRTNVTDSSVVPTIPAAILKNSSVSPVSQILSESHNCQNSVTRNVALTTMSSPTNSFLKLVTLPTSTESESLVTQPKPNNSLSKANAINEFRNNSSGKLAKQKKCQNVTLSKPNENNQKIVPTSSETSVKLATKPKPKEKDNVVMSSNLSSSPVGLAALSILKPTVIPTNESRNFQSYINKSAPLSKLNGKVLPVVPTSSNSSVTLIPQSKFTDKNNVGIELAALSKSSRTTNKFRNNLCEGVPTEQNYINKSTTTSKPNKNIVISSGKLVTQTKEKVNVVTSSSSSVGLAALSKSSTTVIPTDQSRNSRRYLNKSTSLSKPNENIKTVVPTSSNSSFKLVTPSKPKEKINMSILDNLSAGLDELCKASTTVVPTNKFRSNSSGKLSTPKQNYTNKSGTLSKPKENIETVVPTSTSLSVGLAALSKSNVTVIPTNESRNSYINKSTIQSKSNKKIEIVVPTSRNSSVKLVKQPKPVENDNVATSSSSAIRLVTLSKLKEKDFTSNCQNKEKQTESSLGDVADILKLLFSAENPQEQEKFGKRLKEMLVNQMSLEKPHLHEHKLPEKSNSRENKILVGKKSSDTSNSKKRKTVRSNSFSSSSEFQSRPDLPNSKQRNPSRAKIENNIKSRIMSKLNTNPEKTNPPNQKSKVLLTTSGVKIPDPQVMFLGGNESARDSNLEKPISSLDPQTSHLNKKIRCYINKSENKRTNPEFYMRSRSHEKPQHRNSLDSKRDKRPSSEKSDNQAAKKIRTEAEEESAPPSDPQTYKIIGEFLTGIFNPNLDPSTSLPIYLGRNYGSKLFELFHEAKSQEK